MPILPCISQNIHPLPEQVCDAYTKFWADIELAG
jgi:hypothetical protein